MATSAASTTIGVDAEDPAGSEHADDLVRRVADQVYAMLLRDLRLERERLGDSCGSAGRSVMPRGDRGS